MLSEPMVAVVGCQHPLCRSGRDITGEGLELSMGGSASHRQHHSRGRACDPPEGEALLRQLPITHKIDTHIESHLRWTKSVFDCELSSGEASALPLKLGVRWRSTLLTRPEAYITPLVNRVASLFEAAVSNR